MFGDGQQQQFSGKLAGCLIILAYADIKDGLNIRVLGEEVAGNLVTIIIQEIHAIVGAECRLARGCRIGI